MNVHAMRKSWRRFVCLGMLGAMVPLAVGCYGRFPLTHAVYRLNGRVGYHVGEDQTQHKMAQSVVFWILWIIPVYEVSILADAIVLNLIEFWTGETIEISSVQGADGTMLTLRPEADGQRAVLTVSRRGEVVSEQALVRRGDGVVEMRDMASGQLRGTVRKAADGSLELLDAQERVIQTLNAQDLAAL